jgi:bacillithiol biosynthesis deacetylase BshB1
METRSGAAGRRARPAPGSPGSSDAEGVDVLAFAAHPDDAEFFCGGTLLAAARAGHSTAIVDFTEGELSSNGNPTIRARERDRASDLLGLAARRSLGLPDGALGAEAAHREPVVEALRDLSPTVVLAPYWKDRHPDHAAAGRLVREASFLAGLPKYHRGRPHRPHRVYWYMLHRPFDPTVVVDVGSVWERRLELLDVYASQLVQITGSAPSAINDGRFREMLVARARYFGTIVGAQWGEPLYVDGPLRLSLLPELDVSAAPPGRYRAFP